MTSPWPSEAIPDDDFLYMRVFHQMVKTDGTVSTGVFKNLPEKQDGMSTNWSKYCADPMKAKEGARKPSSNYRVIKMNVGAVRSIPEQTVKHTPDWERQNRSHTDVFGLKDEEIRVLFGRAAELLEDTEVSEDNTISSS